MVDHRRSWLRRRYGGRSARWWLTIAAVLVVGLLVLPHVTIDGHRYRFLIF